MRSAIVVLIVAASGLAGAGVASAAVLQVPSGTYPTVQAALDRVATLAGSNEVRIARGSFVEHLRLPNPCCAGQVRISGGWDASFAVRTGDPALTRLDGGGTGRVLEIPSLSSGSVLLENLTLRKGRLQVAGAAVAFGAGLRASVLGSAALVTRDVYVRENAIEAAEPGPAEGQGGGASILLNGAARLVIERCVFEKNAIVETGEARLSSLGGGLNVQVFGGNARVRGVTFRRNASLGSADARGGGLQVLVQRLPSLGFTLEDVEFQGNAVAGTSGGAGAELAAYDGAGSPSIVARRIRFLKNEGGGSQVMAIAYNGARTDMSDSLVAGGDRIGVDAFGNAAYVNLTNLTVTGNRGVGIDARAALAKVSVFNTIAYDNAAGDLRLSGGFAHGGFNLVGIDPLFRDPAAGDYRLSPFSPAIDAGTNSPPGGLGPLDLDRRPRVEGGVVDIGAHEFR